MKLRNSLVAVVCTASFLAACGGSSTDKAESTGRAKNAALGATAAPLITRIDPGDGELTVHVALADGSRANTWFYQLTTEDAAAANPVANGTETVRDAPENFTIAGLTNGVLYTVRVAHWNGETSDYASAQATVGVPTQTSLSSTTTSSLVSVTTTATLPCRSGGDCAIGDVGPGGGIVFYDAGAARAWGRYLEVSPADLAATPFGCGGGTVNAGADALGDGKKNSDEISFSPCGQGTAARLAYAYTLDGTTGWYLPSRIELNELCKFAHNETTGETGKDCAASSELRAGFSPGFYWSSTETNNDFAWYQNFFTGKQLSYGKPTPAVVRPIRAFTNANGVTVPTTLAPLPCKRGGDCKVGDVGPGGGLVFFVAATPQQWGQYLEITASPIAFVAWGCERTQIPGTGKGFGDGPGNTKKLVANGCTAAKSADDFVSVTGKDDWFLPSDDELLKAAQTKSFSNVSSAWTSNDDSCFSGYCFSLTRGPDGSSGSVARSPYSGSVATYAVRMFKKVG